MTLLARRLLVSAVSGGLALAVALAFLGLRPDGEAPPIVLRKIEQDPEWVQRLRVLEADEPPVWVRALPDSTLVRERVTPGGPKARFFPPLVKLSAIHEYDEHAVFRLAAHTRLELEWPEHPDGRYVVTTNAAGLRMDREVASVRPDLRVVLTGDSHIEGVCNNSESTAAALERLLAQERPGQTVEVLNGAVGGYCGYNQLGVLERHLADGVDAFAQVVYGGNDFTGALVYRHYYERTSRAVFPQPFQVLMDATAEAYPAAVGQVLHGAAYFKRCREEAPLAARTVRELCDEIARVCAHHGVRYLCVYLPSAADVEWDAHRAVLEAACERLQLSREDVASADRMADELLLHLRASGVEVLDTRPLLREGGPYFWERDLHLNLAGHARLAEALAARLSASD